MKLISDSRLPIQCSIGLFSYNDDGNLMQHLHMTVPFLQVSHNICLQGLEVINIFQNLTLFIFKFPIFPVHRLTLAHRPKPDCLSDLLDIFVQMMGIKYGQKIIRSEVRTIQMKRFPKETIFQKMSFLISCDVIDSSIGLDKSQIVGGKVQHFYLIPFPECYPNGLRTNKCNV